MQNRIELFGGGRRVFEVIGRVEDVGQQFVVVRAREWTTTRDGFDGEELGPDRRLVLVARP